MQTLIVPLDMKFQARYKILELVHGAYNGQTVDFLAYDHYGRPDFARHDHAMLYLTEHDSALYHQKYQYDRVYPTSDGRYAYCGNPYVFLEGDNIDPRPIADIQFSPPVVLNMSDHILGQEYEDEFDSDYIEERNADLTAYFNDNDFDITGDRARCKRGVYPQELFRIKRETVLYPYRRRDICEAQLKVKIADWEERRSAVQDCIADLKARGIP